MFDKEELDRFRISCPTGQEGFVWTEEEIARLHAALEEVAKIEKKFLDNRTPPC